MNFPLLEHPAEARRTRIAWALAALVLLSFRPAAARSAQTDGPSSAADAKQVRAPAPDPAKSLAAFFNGKDLAGWQGSHDIWRVQPGAIVGVPPLGRNEPCFLATQRKFTDFDLRFEATVEEGSGDCGLEFRAKPPEGDAGRLSGFRCAICGKDAPKDRRTGNLLSDPAGKIEKRAPAKLVERFVKPTTNHFHVRCQGKHVLIEVNGIKTCNADFASLPNEGVIAWTLDGARPPRKATFKITRFADLSGLPVRSAARPSLSDTELLKAEMKFETAIRNADAHLLKQFETEINKLQHASRPADKDLVSIVQHEKEAFKSKGQVPFSRPMRKALAQYAKELANANKVVGKALDAAADRAEKSHNGKLKEALVAEAGTLLVPRPVATWEIEDAGQTRRTIFLSDGSFVTDSQSQNDESHSRFWALPSDDKIAIEFPDPTDSTATLAQPFQLSADGKTLTGLTDDGGARVWRRVEE